MEPENAGNWGRDVYIREGNSNQVHRKVAYPSADTQPSSAWAGRACSPASPRAWYHRRGRPWWDESCGVCAATQGSRIRCLDRVKGEKKSSMAVYSTLGYCRRGGKKRKGKGRKEWFFSFPPRARVRKSFRGGGRQCGGGYYAWMARLGMR